MMPRWEAVIFLVSVGAGLLGYAYHGYQTGEVRAGANLWRGVYRPNREDNPLGFRFFLSLYFCGGIALCMWGLLALIGMAPALRWR